LKGKRLTRREMKEDALVTLSFKALDFLKRHRAKFILGAVAVVAVIVAASAVSSSRKKAEEFASKQLLAGMLQQRRANYSGAAAAYEDVLDRFSGTRSGKLALLYLGHARFELGRYDLAIESYSKYLEREKKDRLTRGQAERGIAACLENQGKFEEAAVRYERVARDLDEEDSAPEDLMAAARCLRLAGEKERAAEILQEIVDSYPDFRELDKAKVYLAELQHAAGGE